jgi:glycosyltransferase involved in cell wall biosynthesis
MTDMDSSGSAVAAEIQILLGTYNYGRYLDQFMESLVAQDFAGWVLLVRDDASSDETPALLEKWRQRLGTQMAILPDSSQSNLGVAGNYSRLLAASTAPYVMFADPDDVWHRDKIRTTLAAMRRAEAARGVGVPCLVHTDLAIVDENLHPVAPSLWRRQGLVPHRGHSLSHMMVENTVWACTAMLNRPLVLLAGPVPVESHHQDWWVALVAAAFGEIVSVPGQTIEWRRHGKNDSEITRLGSVFVRTLMAPTAMRRRLVDLLDRGRPRVRVFFDRYRERLAPDQIAAIEAFLRLPSLGPLARRNAVLRHRLLFTSRLRSAGMLLLL